MSTSLPRNLNAEDLYRRADEFFDVKHFDGYGKAAMLDRVVEGIGIVEDKLSSAVKNKSWKEVCFCVLLLEDLQAYSELYDERQDYWQYCSDE